MTYYPHTFTAKDINNNPLSYGYLYTYYSSMDIPVYTYSLIGSLYVKNAWPLPLDVNGSTGTFYTELETFPNRYNLKDKNNCQQHIYPIDKIINLQQIEVSDMPNIIVQPVDQSKSPGCPTVIEVVATGSDLHYQWYHNGILMPGYTTNQVAFSNTQAVNAGTYYCIIWNTTGTVTSNIIVLVMI